MQADVVIAAVQLNSQASVSDNLNQCSELVAEAAGRGARLVLLPENFAYFGPEAGKLQAAEAAGDTAAPIQAALSAWARAHHLTLVAGGMPERCSDGPPYNTALVYGPDGGLETKYRKLHLFDVDLPGGGKLKESDATSAGSEAVLADAAGVRVGLSICYDLRFPELYRLLVDRGAELLVVPAAFTHETGQAHWEVLLRARAIESQCYLLAANQCGNHPGNRKSYGHSSVIDPWGRVVAELAAGVGVVTAQVSAAELTEVRRRLPCLEHRRINYR